MEPIKRYPGFKVCIFKCNLYRYSQGAPTFNSNLVGLHNLNPVVCPTA
jgi:hypothetical protein